MNTPSPTRTFAAASALLLLAASLACANPVPIPPATYTPGAAPGKAAPAARGCGHLLPAMQDYHSALRRQWQDCPYLSEKGNVTHAAHYRAVAIDLARRFPQEVNDLLRRHDASWATPLSLAVQAQDAELVDILLHLGAVPFGPEANESLESLPLLPNVERKPEITRLLQRARSRVNPLRLVLEHRAAQTRPPARWKGEPEPSPTDELLRTAHHNAYAGEPHVFSFAFNDLSGPYGTILRVQPLSRVVVYPDGQQDGSVTTTARIVSAIEGTKPAFETISWKLYTEGPADAPEGQSVFAPDAEPLFLNLGPKVFERAQAEGGNRNLALGVIDFDTVRRGEKWQAAYERALADFPELAETVPATAEELAAARKVVEDAPILARATVWRYSVELHEEEGTATVHYCAELREPLKGGLIKGALKDWNNVQFSRSFPLSEEWRARAKAFTCYLALPAILVMEEAEGGRKVLQSFNKEDDPAMMRALNQSAFCPFWIPNF